MRKYDDTHWAEVAEIVRGVGEGRHGAAQLIAERWNVPLTTAHSWVKRARGRGLLSTTARSSGSAHQPVWARTGASTSTGAAREWRVCNECLTPWPCASPDPLSAAFIKVFEDSAEKLSQHFGIPLGAAQVQLAMAMAKHFGITPDELFSHAS